MANMIARHHSEWLALLEVSGPFPGLPLLLEVFPQGLEAHDAEVARDLRLAHDEWESDPDPVIHLAWVRNVLRRVLDWPDELVRAGQSLPGDLRADFPEHGVTLRPDLALLDTPGRGHQPRVLVVIAPRDQGLDQPVGTDRWEASHLERLRHLLAATGVPLGLVTNGERWTLVALSPAGINPTDASWYATLWREEPLTLRSWRALLGIHRILGARDGERLADLIQRGAQDQQDVTTTLGNQVRQAIEVLIRRIDQIAKDRDRPELASLDPGDLYNAALTLMMRLIFLFFAEENRLLERGGTLFGASYAVGTIRTQLRAAADRDGEERLERFTDAWCRLLATSRAVFAGADHDELRLIAHGGTLFDPDRYPFLEGRAAGTSWRDTLADPLPIDNRTVLHLLEALQVLQAPISRGGNGVEPRRLSFRALDVEQIGHVYEGLLDHTARRAAEPILGLMTAAKARVPDITLAELESLHAHGTDALVMALAKQTGKTQGALLRTFEAPLDDQAAQRLLGACDNDPVLYERIRPYAGLLRRDHADRPVVITPGGIYVTAGEDRRSTGTHYTPRALTEPIVKHTLDPLVYHGPAEGLPAAQWTLRPAREVLRLKVLDMAMGSGAFLVEAIRYLAARLLDAWAREEERFRSMGIGGLIISSDGTIVPAPRDGIPAIEPFSAHTTAMVYHELWSHAGGVKPPYAGPNPDVLPLPIDLAEREIVARRLVAERCIYGVDKNPMAVEMAKLALWLTTMAHDRPFTFLDHALRCGDSLLGCDIAQLKHWSLEKREAHGPTQVQWFEEPIRVAVAEAERLRLAIALQTDRDIRDLERKAELLRQAEAAMDLLRLGADLLIASDLASTPREREESRSTMLPIFHQVLTVAEEHRQAVIPFADHLRAEQREAAERLRRRADDLLGGRHPFHWPLAFPEVFDPTIRDANPGFDAVIGNPPFMGGKLISGPLGNAYRDYLVERMADGKRGHADLCAYFFLRAAELMRREADAGLLATKTIAEGDTREVGLDRLAADGLAITRAVPNRPWPGEAAVAVAHIWLRRGGWAGQHVLDDQPVVGISPFLTPPAALQGKPFQLAENASKSFIGSYVLGMGFVLTPEEAAALIARDPRNREVLFPYLNGEDLNSRPDQSPSRWVINFHDWPLERAEQYPDCMAIVREKVKPERDILVKKRDKSAQEIGKRWWQFGRTRPALYEAIAEMERVLVTARVSKYIAFLTSVTNSVYSEQIVIIARFSFDRFALLESVFHEFWVITNQSNLGISGRYTPSDCFETFPFPECLRDSPGDVKNITIHRERLKSIGEQYYTYRQGIMLARQEGLTKTYNRFHDPREGSADIAELRRLHMAMDQAVAEAYGWGDLELGHGFHQTKQGVRYTISEAARREVLDRLMALNHVRHASEVAAGVKLGAKRRKRGNGKGSGAGNGVSLGASSNIHGDQQRADDGPPIGDWEVTEQEVLPGMEVGARQMRLGEGEE